MVWSGLVLTLFAAIGDRRMTCSGGATFAMRVLAAPAGTAVQRP